MNHSIPDDETGKALVPADSDEADRDEPVPDAHGFDPAAYRWVPVLRKPRRDGWTPQRPLDFIRTLADTGIVEEAAGAAGMSVTCYRLRNAPEGAAFAVAWETALAHAARRLVDIAFDRAIHGTDEPSSTRRGAGSAGGRGRMTSC